MSAHNKGIYDEMILISTCNITLPHMLLVVRKPVFGISDQVTAKLICVFVFAYAKSRFSHDAAHMILWRIDKSCL